MLFDILYNDLNESLAVFTGRRCRTRIGGDAQSFSPGGGGAGDAELPCTAGPRVGEPASANNNDKPRISIPAAVGSSFVNVRGGSSRLLHSQDLLDLPHYVSASEPGLAIPMSKQLATNTTGDFSLTFWVLVAQDSTGAPRSILLRGTEIEFSPLVVLRPNDRCIEVTLSRRNGVYMPGLLGVENVASEKLTSKSAIPLFLWTHVALVAEASQLRMYINGVLDAQRTNYTNTFPNATGGSQMPLYVGVLPADILSPANGTAALESSSDGVSGRRSASNGCPHRSMQGIEGSIARLRFHARALSPIHVRVDCEKGAPHAAIVPDDECFQLLLLLMLAVQSDIPRSTLCAKRWLVLLFRIAKLGTNRTRQAALRVIRNIVIRAPAGVEQETALSNRMMNSTLLAQLLGLEKEGGFASWMLREIGSAMLVSQRGWAHKDDTTSPDTNAEMSDFRVSFLQMHEGQFRSQISNDGALQPVDGQASLMSASESTHYTFSQVSEAVSLLRYLADADRVWCRDIRTAVMAALRDAMKSTAADRAQDSGARRMTEQRDQMALAAIMVLGGNFETLRVGGRVSLSHTDLTATLLSLKCDMHTSSGLLFATSAEVAIGRRSSLILENNVSGPQPHTSALKSISMSTDELIVVSGTEVPVGTSMYGKAQLSELVATTTWLLALTESIDKEAGASSHSSSEDTKDATESKDATEFQGGCVSWWRQGARERLLSPAAPRLAQMLSSVLKCLHVLSTSDGKNSNLNSLALDVTALVLQEETLFRDLLHLATKSQISENNETLFFSTLPASMMAGSGDAHGGNSRPLLTVEETEYATVLLRQRLVTLGLTKAAKRHAGVAGKDDDRTLVGTGDHIPGYMTAIQEDESIGLLTASSSAPLSTVPRGMQLYPGEHPGGESKSGSASSISLMSGTRSATSSGHGNQSSFDPPAEMVEELMTMGFPREWCITALREKENDMVDASTWIVDNLDFLGSGLSGDGALGGEENAGGGGGGGGGGDEDGDEDCDDSSSLLGADGDSTNACAKKQQDQQDHDDQVLLSGGGVDVLDDCRVYFPGDSQHDISWYDNSSGSNSARQARFQAIAASISAVADSGVRRVLLEAELSLASMYSQHVVLDVFQCWLRLATNPAMSPGSLLSPSTINLHRIGVDSLLRFAKLSLLQGEAMQQRGQVLSAATSSPDSVLPKESPPLIEDFGSLGVQSLLKTALVQMLKASSSSSSAERAAGTEPARAGLAALSVHEMRRCDPGTPPPESDNLDSLKAALNASNRIELAEDEDILYMAPSAAFSEWCLDVLLATIGADNDADDALLISVFEEYARHVNTACLSLGEFIFSGLSKMLRCQTARAAALSPPLSSSRFAVFSTALSAAAIKTTLEVRLKLERSNGRMLHSTYLQQLEELLLSMRIYDALEGTTAAVSSSPPSSSSSSTTTSRSAASAESKVEGAMVMEEKRKDGGDEDEDEDLPFHAASPGFEHATSQDSSTCNTIRFDPIHCGPSIRISDDGLSASFSSSESWSSVLGNQGFMQGKNYWEIRIDRSPTAYLFVGVALRHANLSTFLGGDQYGWGYIGDRALYHKRSKLKLYGDRFGQGDVIGVTLDMDEGTLSFTRNGLDLGVAIQHLSGVIYPAVAFYNRGQRVSFVPRSFSLEGAGISIPGSPENASVDSILEAGEIFKAAAHPRSSVYTFPRKFVRHAYDDYCRWVEGSTKRFLTQSGFEVQLSVSDDDCAALGRFLSGDRVRSSRGMCTICGVAGGKLWRLVDGEQYVWFFGSKELLTSKLIKAAPGTESVGAAGVGAAGFGIAASLPRRRHRTSTKTIGVSFREFADVLLSGWTQNSLLVDYNMVRAANDVCEQSKKLDATNTQSQCDNIMPTVVGESSSPWNISCDMLVKVIVPLELAECSRRNSRCPTPIEMRGPARYASKNFEQRALMVRWAVLRALNEAMLPVFPFIDLSEAYHYPLTAHPYAAAVDGHTGLRSSVGACDMFHSAAHLLVLEEIHPASRARSHSHAREEGRGTTTITPEDLSTVVLCRPKGCACQVTARRRDAIELLCVWSGV